jgi:hypothetical protein
VSLASPQVAADDLTSCRTCPAVHETRRGTLGEGSQSPRMPAAFRRLRLAAVYLAVVRLALAAAA